MRVPSVLTWASAALCLLAALAPSVDASAVTAGAPEHLIATGGECVRTFHSKGSVGCRSRSNKDIEPLFAVDSADDLARFVRGDAPTQDKAQKYVLVMPEALLTYDAIASAIDRIGGVFAYPQFSVANASFASSTPQGAGTVDGALNPFAGVNVSWNAGGNGLIERELPFPVVLLANERVGEAFTARAKTNAQDNSGATYKAFLKYYFGPEAMTSLECLRFKNIYGQQSPKCDPIGGQSAWSVRGDRSAQSIVLATAAMDASGLSHVLSPGANTAASGLVALLAAAQALQAIPDSAFGKKLVFAAFQAEKFGFVGSRKFLEDLQRFTRDPKTACAFPVTDSASPFGSDFCTHPMLSSTAFASLSLADIAYAIAVDQVGILPPSGNFTVHVNPLANSSATVSAATETTTTETLAKVIMTAPSAGKTFSVGTTGALPPTPLTSFVNAGEYGRADLVGAVIAGYDGNAAPGTFNTRHDTVDRIDVAAVTKASQVLAETLYTLAAKTVSTTELKTIQVNRTHVGELLTCISTNWRCDLMKSVSAPAVATMLEYLDLSSSSYPAFQKPATLYSGPLDVNRQMLVKKRASKDDVSYYTLYNQSWSETTDSVKLFPNAYEVFTRAALAAAMVDAPTAKAASACTKSQTCGKGMECVAPGVCVKQAAYFHFAISPGLERTKTLGLYAIVNESLPLWTEPQWENDIGSYVFPDPGELIGWLALAIGVAVTGVGVVLARFVLTSVHKMKLL